MNEQELISALRRRDAVAQRTFCSSYRERIYAVTFRLLRDECDAEEAVQDTLFAVCTKIDTFQGQSAFWSWVFRIAENAARMKMRTHKRRPLLLEEDDLQALMAPFALADSANRPDHALRERRCIEGFTAALADADPVNRSLFLAMDFDGREKEAVASEHSLSIPALKARLHRVRESLKTRMLAAA